jgi:alpha-glucosidase
VFDNHDNVRSWDRFGDGVHDAAIARIIAALLLTSRATALIYQGQEIGQTTATPQRVQDVRDPIGITGWPKEKGRDGERTPMQWDAGAQAGFSSSPHTWLPITANYTKVNVAAESQDPQSLLNWYRSLIALRRDNPALRGGRMVMLDPGNAGVLTYARVTGDGRGLLICLNMSPQAQSVDPGLSGAGLRRSRLHRLLSSPAALPDVAAGARFTLPPYAAFVGALR